MLPHVTVTCDAELWAWDARQADSWVFMSLPAEASEEIREQAGARVRRGFGSIRVGVTIGGSTWATSIFRDTKRGGYVLPVKRAVRTAEGLAPGDVAKVTLAILDV